MPKSRQDILHEILDELTPPTPLEVLQREIADWLAKIQKVLFRYENLRRLDLKLPRLNSEFDVQLLPNQNDSLRLLNWKVWSLRHHVSLDFILTTLLDYFSKRRAPQGEFNVSLGISVGSLTGVKARKILEEEILKAFPDGENIKSALQTPVPPPLQQLKYDTMEEFVQRYGRHMKHRQRKFNADPPRYRRNFRKL